MVMGYFNRWLGMHIRSFCGSDRTCHREFVDMKTRRHWAHGGTSQADLNIHKINEMGSTMMEVDTPPDGGAEEFPQSSSGLEFHIHPVRPNTWL